jgi:cysteine desulfurase/selenocysteine lyase
MSGTDPDRNDYDVEAIRQDFPILKQLIHGKPLVYLDNAATTQKPQAVIDRLMRYYTEDNANIHRAVHLLSERATLQYEEARKTIQRFVRAASPREIIYTRGTTEGINLVASSYGRASLTPDDEVLITAMEHHSNIVPWQLACDEAGAFLRVAAITDSGELDMRDFERLLTRKTKIVAVGHISNALGTVNPVAEIIGKAHSVGAVVVVDGAQSAPHVAIDVQALDCDFFAFSGHKIYGPTGIGVLYGKAALLESMPVYQGGGDMIRTVTFEKTTYNDLPYKFEAGTPHISGAIGLAEALRWVEGVGIERIAEHEADLLAYGTEVLSAVPGLHLVGTAREKAGVLSFVMDGIHPHDIGTLVDRDGVAIRTGHHCAQPVMDRFGIPATARASVACYNTREELDVLAESLTRVGAMFA